MKPEHLLIGAGAAAALYLAHRASAAVRTGAVSAAEFPSRFANTATRAGELFVGGDGLNNVTGAPQTLGGAVYDAQTAVTDRARLIAEAIGGVFDRSVPEDPAAQAASLASLYGR